MKGIIKNILLVGVFSTLLLSCEKDGKNKSSIIRNRLCLAFILQVDIRYLKWLSMVRILGIAWNR